jgi:peptidoglycan/xylan/chitin deacetylase (PgdA/CDA1 family)
LAGTGQSTVGSSHRRVWVPILYYHRVVASLPAHDPFGNCIHVQTFRSQLAWLARRGYHSIPLAALSRVFESDGRDQSLGPRPIVITFDDGYEDVYTQAWPVLAEFGFTATVFLVSDAIGRDNAFDAAYVSERVPMLAADQIRALSAAGVSFGSHSRTHPASLPDLPDDLLLAELQQSRAAIATTTGEDVETFAYPHSRLDGRVEAAVAAAGYRLACAGVGTRFDPFCLHRIDGARAGAGARVEVAIWRRRLKRMLARRSAPIRRRLRRR